MQKGIEVIFTTGRGLTSVKSLAEETGANHYVICGNGAIIYDLQKKQPIYQNLLDKKKILQLIQICEENSIYYCIYTEDSIITKTLNYNTLFYNNENSKKTDDKKTNIQIVQNIYQYILEREKEDYSKIMICDDDNIIFNSIIQKLKKVKNVDVLEVGHMSKKIIKEGTKEYPLEYYYTEISSQNVDKWSAISYLISKLEIKKEEVIAIGDNINDQTMLENAGLGIAMGNSAPYIQKMANEVTLTNDENGVAAIIEKYV